MDGSDAARRSCVVVCGARATFVASLTKLCVQHDVVRPLPVTHVFILATMVDNHRIVSCFCTLDDPFSAPEQ